MGRLKTPRLKLELDAYQLRKVRDMDDLLDYLFNPEKASLAKYWLRELKEYKRKGEPWTADNWLRFILWYLRAEFPEYLREFSEIYEYYEQLAATEDSNTTLRRKVEKKIKEIAEQQLEDMKAKGIDINDPDRPRTVWELYNTTRAHYNKMVTQLRLAGLVYKTNEAYGLSRDLKKILRDLEEIIEEFIAD